MKYSSNQLEAIRMLLAKPEGADLVELMFCMNMGLTPGDSAKTAWPHAEMLGWIDSASGQLTDLGHCASDSCREYRFWLDRGRALPFEGTAPHLTLEYFRNKTVAEIGCGIGANLMSMRAVAEKVIGVEPLEAYRQMATLLWQNIDLSNLEIIPGSGENTGLGDAEYDVVICVTAHQYFDIRAAMNEMARLLKPGGEIIIIGSSYKGYVLDALRNRPLRPSQLKAFGLNTINTLGYMTTRRRLIPASGGSTTSRPIFPTVAALKKWMTEVGLKVDVSPTWLGTEVCVKAAKAA